MIAKLDRLFRNLVFVAALMDSGIEFGAVDNPRYPHANRLTLHILAAVAPAREGSILRLRHLFRNMLILNTF
jgi:hypothetical protein